MIKAKDFQKILYQARTLAKENPEVKLIVLAKTDSAVHHSLITDYTDPAQLTALADELKAKEDTRVRFLLSMFTKGQCIDAPSAALRDALLALDPANGSAQIPVNGEHDGQAVYVMKTLADFC